MGATKKLTLIIYSRMWRRENNYRVWGDITITLKS